MKTIFFHNGVYVYSEEFFNFEDDDSTIRPCIVPTRLLCEIVKAWLDEFEKFSVSKK